MNLEIFPQQLLLLLMLFVRVLAILSLTPVISTKESPFFVRVALAMLTAFAVQNLIHGTAIIPSTIGQLVVVIVGEALIGFVIGFFIQMVFSLLVMFSEFFSTQMGLRAAQVLNPLSNDNTAVIGQFISIIVTLVFIASFSIQKIFYYGVAQSFAAINSQDLFFYKDNGSFLVFIFWGLAKLFERSFIIALPIFISLLLINIGLGLYGRVAPQMNLLILGVPLQIGIGLLVIMILIPSMITAIEAFLDTSLELLNTFIRAVK